MLDVIKHGQLNLLNIKIYLRYQYIMKRRWSTIQPILTNKQLTTYQLKNHWTKIYTKLFTTTHVDRSKSMYLLGTYHKTALG